MKNQFSVVVRFTKQLDNGTFKKVAESYLVSAASFCDAESKIFEEVAFNVKGEFTVQAIKRENFQEIFFAPEASENFFICKVSVKSFDPDSEQKKASKLQFLVNAETTEKASSLISEEMKNAGFDFKVEKVALSKIVEIIFNS